ncbi:hypothetical protein FS837_004390 [Tulasnella sp. UAMH 9824]|nr:hypothetical protein FS837_004390 [Tulasnella sp. UAMH 9824]
MSQISSSGTPLALSSTLDEPAKDPGLRLKLKRNDSGRDCFDKFHPYLVWLRSFIHKNKWLTGFDSLWELYYRQESQFGKLTAIQEFFSQKAHSEVEKLWIQYRDLRRQIEDLATQRVTMRVSQAADSMATTELRSGGMASETTASKVDAWPDYAAQSPFLDPSAVGNPFSNPQDA